VSIFNFFYFYYYTGVRRPRKEKLSARRPIDWCYPSRRKPWQRRSIRWRQEPHFCCPAVVIVYATPRYVTSSIHSGPRQQQQHQQQAATTGFARQSHRHFTQRPAKFATVGGICVIGSWQQILTCISSPSPLIFDQNQFIIVSNLHSILFLLLYKSNFGAQKNLVFSKNFSSQNKIKNKRNIFGFSMFTRFSHNIMFTLFSISVISVFQKFKQNRIFSVFCFVFLNLFVNKCQYVVCFFPPPFVCVCVCMCGWTMCSFRPVGLPDRCFK
jgi:hypothetical protein